MKAHTSYYQIGKLNGEIVFACESMDLKECLMECNRRGFRWPSDTWATFDWDSYAKLPM